MEPRIKRTIEIVIAFILSLPMYYWAGESINEPDTLLFLLGLVFVVVPTVYWIWKGYQLIKWLDKQ